MFFRIIILCLIAAPATAQVIESVYTNLDTETDCTWTVSEFAEEAAQGGAAVCDGLDGYPVYLGADDARMSIQFGQLSDSAIDWDGFANFNYVNDVVEWRLHDGKPVAAIIRWFVTPWQSEGTFTPPGDTQILVVMSVADPDLPEDKRSSCHVAYIDALANENANVLARQMAFLAASNFQCGVDEAIYVGKVGELVRATEYGDNIRDFE